MKKLEYISEEQTLTESQPRDSFNMSNSNYSENTKWLKYGVSKVKNGEIDEFIQDRLYLVDTHSESAANEVAEHKHTVATTKSVQKKCRALSKKLQPLNDKFDTDYTTLELIGSGNFGQVFKAKNNRNGKICAVKKSKYPFVSYKDRRSKEEEIRKWNIITNQYKQLQSGTSNCLELYEAWEENGYLYSSSEYCENGNFAEWLRSRSIKLSKKETYKCILDMALAIKQVHDCNIVHMDIKPDNFLVKADNTIKLGDFGLAVDLKDLEDNDNKVDEVNTSMRKKNINVSEGDASYLAPELLSFNVKVTKKVDVFSFGLCLIECFNSDGITKLPQNGELWVKVRENNPSSFIKFPYTDLAELIDHMTKKQVSARYSIEDVLSSHYIQRLYNEQISTPLKEKVRIPI